VQLDQSSIGNNLLRGLSSADYGLLADDLVRVDLVRAQELSSPGEAITHCWFLEDGIASMVATSREGHETEAGIVGHEGMTDVATILGSASSPLRCFIQIPGRGLRIPVRVVVAAYQASASMRTSFNLFAYAMLCQIAQTALANASFSVEERLARWLLMCDDRLTGDEIALTHEFLSVMLNVRRAGVTLALHALQSAGFLETRRGAIRIVDREGLEEFAVDAYTAVI
jgi:CRP-like cAMP-binding protein